MKKFLTCICFSFFLLGLNAQQKIEIPGADGIKISASMYTANDSMPYIVLCHQADYSRGEYAETAKKLNKLGYNCLAVDLRLGQEINGVVNETAAAYKNAGKQVTHLDAEQDIIAAIDFLYFTNERKVILMGSSYSAALAIKIGSVSNKVKAVIAYSPGDYLGTSIKLEETAKLFDKPIYLTSSKDEVSGVISITRELKSQNKTQFIPKGKGDHGSKVLWDSCADYPEYWYSLIMFLTELKAL
ncbi:MAG: dienelactone hydrolase family protein [Bacteroidetes bacterium]|nr:dienelactone hydrolase family protein [Bacteroidota bacterium]